MCDAAAESSARRRSCAADVRRLEATTGAWLGEIDDGPNSTVIVIIVVTITCLASFHLWRRIIDQAARGERRRMASRAWLAFTRLGRVGAARASARTRQPTLQRARSHMRAVHGRHVSFVARLLCSYAS